MHVMQNPISWKPLETPFDLRVNNHKKDVANDLKAIPTCHHFEIHGHNFMKHAKFTLTIKQNIKCK